MAKDTDARFTIYFGPSLAAPFPAAIADFTDRFATTLTASDIQRHLHEIVPASVKLPKWEALAPLSFEGLVAMLANAWQDLRGPNGLPYHSERMPDGSCRVTIGYTAGDAAIMALRAGILLAQAVFSRATGATIDKAGLAASIQQTAAVIESYQPDYVARALMRAGRPRGIPVYPIAPGSSAWMYGQGKRGYQFIEASTHRDSLIGRRLSHDKIWSNELIGQLGLPGVEHMPAQTVRTARLIARRLGFPLVLKPVGGAKGKGVTLDIRNESELDAAFTRAQAVDRGPVLVERYIAGDDFRLSVFGGKLMRASRLSPPHVIGNGAHTVTQLIEAENRNRSDADVASGLVIRLAVDSDMIALVSRQGFALADRPPQGVKVLLRQTANLHTGGTLSDMTAVIHADNVALAETIAGAFHLDAVGIDFITPDISRSWRDIRCGVIEVNAAPGIGDVLAERIVADKFPAGSDGRIPSILLVGAVKDFADRIVEAIEESGLRTGYTDATMTRLGDQQRFVGNASLPARIMSLLLDPACEAIVIGATTEDIARHGVAGAPFGLALVVEPDKLPKEIFELVARHAARVIEGAGEEHLTGTILPAITAVIDRDKARALQMSRSRS